MDPTLFNWLESRRMDKTGRTAKLAMEALGRGGASNGITNGTREIVDGLVLDKIQQVRYMHIAFGAVSILLVAYIILRIWYDSWRASQLTPSLRRRKLDFLWKLHPAESFPLLLGVFLLIQQISFVSIQAKTLDKLFVDNCLRSSQVVFTQIFMIGYIHFVFGLEMTIRSLRRTRFAPRPKYTTSVCTLIALIMSVFTWLSTRLRMPRNKCFGDMIWRSVRSSPLGVVICSFLIPSFIMMAAIIALQLYRTVNVDPNERIAGTRMVYYLLLSAVLYTLVLPFWVQAVLSSFDKHLSSSRVAEFILFIAGAVVAFTHLFLRANAARTAIRPKNTPWQERKGLRLFGPSDLELMRISSPIMKQGYQQDEKVLNSWISTDDTSKNGAPMEADSIFPVVLPKANMTNVSPWPLKEPKPPPKDQPIKSPMASKAPTTPRKTSNHQRQASYSLFPGSDDLRLPASVYTPGTMSKASVSALAPTFTNPFAGTSPIAKPPSTPWHASHRRGSSNESMATVQIGIRFSTAPAALAASGLTSSPQPPARMGILQSVSSVNTCPSPRSNGLPLDPRSPLSPKQQIPSSQYAWLDIANSPASMDSPLRTQMMPIPPQRATAESNRHEIASLEQSGSFIQQGFLARSGSRSDAGNLSGFF
ncbi:gb [Venturia nashicola]|uniref:Gb n=1 Tax=Venturia nashicola TaxID=86259 RepID=A0A4Z1NVJ6_9PEZI|nr:gb [Venturia nashicola]TLD31791.1 gb [Venturia nashicola]